MPRPQPADPRNFEPGHGQLEEELIDDEETDLPVIQADASDDYEEETLENAADLGTMLREMSIDQITRPELPELDEDEDEDLDFDIAEEEMEEDELESDGAIAASDIDEVEEEHAAEEEEFGDSEPTEAVEAEGGSETTTEREPERRFRRDTTALAADVSVVVNAAMAATRATADVLDATRCRRLTCRRSATC